MFSSPVIAIPTDSLTMMNARLQQLELIYASQSQHIHSLQAQISEKETAYQQLEFSHANQSTLIKSLEAEICGHKIHQDESVEDILTLSRKNQMLIKEIELLKHELEKQFKSKEEADKQASKTIAELSSGCEKLKAEIWGHKVAQNGSAEDILMLSRKNQLLIKESESLKQELEKQIKLKEEADKQAAKTIAESSSECETLRKSNQSLDAKLAEQAKKIIELEADKATLEIKATKEAKSSITQTIIHRQYHHTIAARDYTIQHLEAAFRSYKTESEQRYVVSEVAHRKTAVQLADVQKKLAEAEVKLATMQSTSASISTGPTSVGAGRALSSLKSTMFGSSTGLTAIPSAIAKSPSPA